MRTTLERGRFETASPVQGTENVQQHIVPLNEVGDRGLGIRQPQLDTRRRVKAKSAPPTLDPRAKSAWRRRAEQELAIALLEGLRTGLGGGDAVEGNGNVEPEEDEEASSSEGSPRAGGDPRGPGDDSRGPGGGGRGPAAARLAVPASGSGRGPGGGERGPSDEERGPDGDPRAILTAIGLGGDPRTRSDGDPRGLGGDPRGSGGDPRGFGGKGRGPWDVKAGRIETSPMKRKRVKNRRSDLLEARVLA